MTGEKTRSRGRTVAFTLVAICIMASVLLVTSEIILRLAGYEVLYTTPVNIQVEPGGRLFESDSILGYRHLSGAFRVTVRDSLTFGVTHNADGLRITSNASPGATTPATPQLWILGGSFVHGWTVDDTTTFPWLVRERLPGLEVVNFGVNGYGTVHALLQIDAAIARGAIPETVVVSYASYHDERNTFLRLRRKAVFLWSRLGDVRQPYASIGSDGAIALHHSSVVYKEFPLTRRSVLAHAIERLYNRFEQRRVNSHEVSKLLIREIDERAERFGFRLVIAGIYQDDVTESMLTYCRDLGIDAVDISVDLSRPEYNNLPYDSHPSAAAHRQFANKLAAFLLGSQLPQKAKPESSQDSGFKIDGSVSQANPDQAKRSASADVH